MENISKLIYDSYRGNIPTQYTSVSKEAREEAIRKEIFGVLGISEYTNRTTFRKACRKHKEEMYSVVEDLGIQVQVNGDYLKNAFFNQFVEVRNMALGDKPEFYVEGENQLEFAEFSGSHWNLRRTRIDVGSSFTPEMKDYGIKVYEYFERAMAGRADIASIVIMIADAMERKLAEIAQATFGTAISNLPTEFKVTGSYDEGEILEMLSHVEASNGVKPILVGTSVALAKLQGKTEIALSDKMAEEMNNMGYLTVWKGYRCMEISQGHKIGTFTFTMDNTKIYALTGGEKPVKMVLEGDVEVKEISDGTTNADRTLEHTVIFKAGCSLCYNRMFGYIEVV